MSGSENKQLRSWMFVPGNRDRFIQKAKSSSADAILLDIEDGVLPAEKQDARRMIAAALQEPWNGPRRYVRVNALSTPWLEPDLEAVIGPGIDGICLTKVARPQDVLETASLIEMLEKKTGLEAGAVRILAAVESARGLMNALAIADSHPRIVGLMFGAEDYALDIGLGARREKEAAELSVRALDHCQCCGGCRRAQHRWCLSQPGRSRWIAGGCSAGAASWLHLQNPRSIRARSTSSTRCSHRNRMRSNTHARSPQAFAKRKRGAMLRLPSADNSWIGRSCCAR